MPKIHDANPTRTKIKAKTVAKTDVRKVFSKWWALEKESAVADAVYGAAAYLKQNQGYRYRQTSIFTRLYANLPVQAQFGLSGKMQTGPSLPTDRPTFNLVQACVDTLNSRLTQARPRPYFLTDGGNYKKRSLAKKLNEFTYGEFHSIDAYKLGEQVLRDAEITGTGCIQVYEDGAGKIAAERVMLTDLLVDEVDGMLGDPVQLHKLKLVDRERLTELFPKKAAAIMGAPSGAFDSSASSADTISDQVIVVESWHLKSGPNAKDGRHVIAIPGVLLRDEEYEEDVFPFVFLHYAPRSLGFWAQGLAEQLMGTQIELNRLLITTSRAINLTGVPRVFVEEGSAVVSAHLNNEVGTIVKYRGIKPSYEVAPCMPEEVYAQIQRLIEYGFQQSGVSALAATSQKPAGLNSGEAIRNYDDLQTDRFNTLAKRYEHFYLDLADQIIRLGMRIKKRDGKYRTIAPGKTSIRHVMLPNFEYDDFVIDCYPVSSLPKDPEGRLQKITEMMQAGILSPEEGRRLLDFPDLEQVERLANAAEERIFMVLDDIVEEGKVSPPDPTFNLQLAKQFSVQYINLYAQLKLEEERMQMLRDWSSQVDAIMQAAMPPAPAMGGAPQAVPQAPPVSDVLPNSPQAA